MRWFGHVERKDDNDWVKRCIMWEVEGIRQRGRPKRPGGIEKVRIVVNITFKNDMESLSLSQKDVQSRNTWKKRIKGATG